MKSSFIILVSLTILGALGGFLYLEYMGYERPYIAFSSTSPDGKWKCDVIDYDCNEYTFTYRFKMYKLVNGHEVDTYGTELIQYIDSDQIGPLIFSWSSAGLTIDAGKFGVYDGRIEENSRNIWWSERDMPTIDGTEPSGSGAP